MDPPASRSISFEETAVLSRTRSHVGSWRARRAAMTLAATMALAGAALLAALPTSSPVPTVYAAASPKAYVGLFKEDAVAVLDTASNTVLSKIAVPTGPHGMVATPD